MFIYTYNSVLKIVIINIPLPQTELLCQTVNESLILVDIRLQLLWSKHFSYTFFGIPNAFLLWCSHLCSLYYCACLVEEYCSSLDHSNWMLLELRKRTYSLLDLVFVGRTNNSLREHWSLDISLERTFSRVSDRCCLSLYFKGL